MKIKNVKISTFNQIESGMQGNIRKKEEKSRKYDVIYIYTCIHTHTHIKI